MSPNDDIECIDKKRANPSVEIIERKVSSPLPEDDGDSSLLGPLRKSAEKRLVRKLDLRLLPIIIAIYVLNYIDVRFAPIILFNGDIHCRFDCLAYCSHCSSTERFRARPGSYRFLMSLTLYVDFGLTLRHRYQVQRCSRGVICDLLSRANSIQYGEFFSGSESITQRDAFQILNRITRSALF